MALLNKIAGEITGLSDIGKILTRDEYGQAEADDYVMNEDNEEILYVIKSKKDEYCFTNLALIHVDGESATSSKRVVRRLDYRWNAFNRISIETAGNLDKDVEIKFDLGKTSYSIDVDKRQLEQLKDLYKALKAIQFADDELEILKKSKENSLNKALTTFGTIKLKELSVDDFETLYASIDAKQTELDAMRLIDHGAIFKKYIEN